MNIKNKGFTLIELLVVIAIIGILAALIIVALSGAQRRARDTQRKNNAKAISLAMEQYAVDNSGSYPASAQANFPVPTYDCPTAITTLITASYMSSNAICKDPTTGKTASYAAYSTGSATLGSSYILAWLLENTQEIAKTGTSGNGVYGPTSGSLTVNGLTLTGLDATTNVKYFVVYGPQ
ncbi:prepilin-type N-terminal cleavage/methylation domain-containing protein [Candidatus Berkelbacteria bacterium]|nr:prepilin-type N-terminal cleavage/methylation domain-containing protein [Candidatus Berkelbacteria bacterium]